MAKEKPELRAWLVRFGGLFRKRRDEAEMAAEMREHIELLTERNVAAGMSPNEARNSALREFGGVEQIKELAREQHLLRSLDEFVQDLRYGARMLLRNPGFSVLAILCLTLGIGTNVAVFSWIEGILFRPYPTVAHQERMVALAGTSRGEEEFNPVSYPDLLDLENNCTLIESFIVDRIMSTTLSIGDRAERATGSIVSANYFDALGIRPILGRGFRPEEGRGRNAHPVTVISYDTWRNRYGADPAIIGRTQMLNGVQHTIIGVAPENFHGTFVGSVFQFWVPTSMQEKFDPTGYNLEGRGARWIEGYAFLKPSVTLRQAQDEISAVMRRLENDFPETNRGHGVRLLPLSQSPFNAVRYLAPTLKIALGVVLFVLLIACANVGNLLLVRALMRRHEMTMRLALGARRSRLLKQLFTEGLLLALISAAGGILIAYWCRDALVLAFPPSPGVVANFSGQIDWRVLVLSIGVAIAATLLAGVVPALRASNVDLASALKTESGGVFGGRAKSRLRSALVVLQISLSFILIAAATLLLQSMQQIRAADPGFTTNGVIASSVDLASAGYDLQRAKSFQEQLIDRLRTLPGIETVAWSRVRPFSYRDYSSAPIATDDYQPAPDEQPTVEYNEVSEDYFAALGIPILNGREFLRTDDESPPLVAIVNETMAAKYWPGKNALGQRLRVKDRWMQVVGVAKNAHYRNQLEKPTPFFYVPARQNLFIQTAVFLRTRQGPGAMMNTLAQQLHALDPSLAPLDTVTLREQVERMSYSQRLPVVLLAIFGVMALFLAAIGLYGVMSYAVSQSTRELGLRMALGAGVAALLRLVFSRGFGLIIMGVLVGTIAAAALTRFMGELLYKVSPRDPLAFGMAFVIMLAVGFAACFFPARRATRIDPVRALRA